jgi:hypothetical protein
VLIWRYSADLSTIEAKGTFGPIGKQRPVDIAVGMDGRLRLCWRGTDASNRHTLFLWTLKADLSGADVTVTFAPPTATQQVALGAGVDNKARVFWGTTTALDAGKNWLFTTNAADNALETTAPWGPYANLAAQDLAAGFDNKARLLWRDMIAGPLSGLPGAAHLYRMNSAGSGIEYDFPLTLAVTDASAARVTASLLSRSMWVLWQFGDGRCYVQSIDPSTGRPTAAGFTYWPF